MQVLLLHDITEPKKETACKRQSIQRLHLELREIRFDSSMLKQVIQNGVPSGFQNSVIAIANVFIQSNINAFGKMAMAGCGSYSKIEGFAFLPVTCFTMALTTFVSQNLGGQNSMTGRKREQDLEFFALLLLQS